MIQYGLISQTDARCIEKTLDLVCSQFPDEIISTLEVGVFDGGTSRGIYEYVTSKTYDEMVDPPEPPIYTINRKCYHTAIDNEKDKLVKPPFPECNFIRGNSNEVYNQLQDESQHFIFFDGCHCFTCVIADVFAYAPKIKVGGFACFHDTGKHIKKFKDFQHGDKNNPDAYISVRKSLQIINMLKVKVIENGWKVLYEYIGNKNNQWQLIFDEADPENEAGGVCVFQKLY